MTTKLVRIWTCRSCEETVTITVQNRDGTEQLATQDLLLMALEKRHKKRGCELRTGDAAVI